MENWIHLKPEDIGQNYHHIWLLKEEEKNNLPGYYFSDESEGMNGPFATLEEVKNIFDTYCKTL